MRLPMRASLRALERSFKSASLSSSPASIAPAATPFSIITRRTASPSSLPRSPFLSLQLRYASHQAQGRANSGSKNSPGKRLGAKKGSEQYVVPGNIIFRQRGTKWFPGENCGMGRDHTIYATEAGYVKYYLDPERHPKRKYIGVCFERDGTLPTPRNAPTRRRLNMRVVPRMGRAGTASDLATMGNDPTTVVDVEAAARQELLNAQSTLPLRPGYMYREANWEIGRAAEKAGITAKEFDRKNRWMAWRRRQARAQRAAQMKSLKGKKKGGKKSKARK